MYILYKEKKNFFCIDDFDLITSLAMNVIA